MALGIHRISRLNLKNMASDKALERVEIMFNLLVEVLQANDYPGVVKREATVKPTREGELLFTGTELKIALKDKSDTLTWVPITLG